ncbi:MAG: malto-oligosyltrehalose trehalohydrolase [Candidatus Aramenus sp.]|nr:malto-oligosyltrehalose trehalohydrolase [Candidatus Aramenus sp.]
MTWRLDIGANCLGEEVKLRVWAPYHERLSVVLYGNDRRVEEMEREERGYFSLVTKGVKRYAYLVKGKELPDPASRFQPEGVHGPSQVVCNEFHWEDKDWKGLDVNSLVIYELHVGTFSESGDFQGVIGKLDYLADLGVTAVELMPVSQFAGSRNWGYDGVLLYAVQNSYGGPEGLKKLVNEAHKRGIGVIVDVVYNHVGPEGNYLGEFGPYFSTRYRTPWGPTFNFDEAWSDEVRHYVVQNALYWFHEYHVDGLRLDSVPNIFDMSPRHILAEIADEVRKAEGELGKRLLLIAESDLNDPKIVNPREKCGYGIDAQWSDDLHHALHAYATGERDSYYQDFGEIGQIAKALKDVFVYDGIYSKFRKKTYGAPVGNLGGEKFVVYSQNHDQVGNRKDGKRLISLVGKDVALIVATLYIMSPYIPMIFMGEEYGEENPFLFFTDFSDPELVKNLREGRKRELGEHYYDPQDYSTFQRSKLSWKVNKDILEFYKGLIAIKKKMVDHSREIEVETKDSTVLVKRRNLLVIASFTDSEVEVEGTWKLLLASSKFPERLTGKVKVPRGAGIYTR